MGIFSLTLWESLPLQHCRELLSHHLKILLANKREFFKEISVSSGNINKGNYIFRDRNICPTEQRNRLKQSNVKYTCD